MIDLHEGILTLFAEAHRPECELAWFGYGFRVVDAHDAMPGQLPRGRYRTERVSDWADADAHLRAGKSTREIEAATGIGRQRIARRAQAIGVALRVGRFAKEAAS